MKILSTEEIEFDRKYNNKKYKECLWVEIESLRYSLKHRKKEEIEFVLNTLLERK